MGFRQGGLSWKMEVMTEPLALPPLVGGALKAVCLWAGSCLDQEDLLGEVMRQE